MQKIEILFVKLILRNPTNHNQPLKIETMFSLPRLPARLVKQIASIRPARCTDVSDYAEHVMSIFIAFMPSTEAGEYEINQYKKEVQERLAGMVYDPLAEWYLRANENYAECSLEDLCLTPQDIMDLYEVTFIGHYSQSYGAHGIANAVMVMGDDMIDIFVHITHLLENYTTLYDNEAIMGGVTTLSSKHLKFISLLERCLLGRRGELLKFMYAQNLYAPILAFYLYVKHNHVDYRTKENSLAKDTWLLRLLLITGSYEKELLALAIGGLFPNDYTVVENYSIATTFEEHMCCPNPAVVEIIIGEFPAICKERIPFYMRPTTMNGDEAPHEIVPLHYWNDYENTFKERKYIRHNIYTQREKSVVKNQLIGRLLESASFPP